MKRIISAASALCILTLAGCQTPGSDSASNLGGAVGTIIGVLPTSVQAKVLQGCGYELPLVTIASIIATFSGSKASAGTAFATAVADGICRTVNAAPAPAPSAAVSLFAARAAPPAYRGVVLDGKFVR